MKIILVLLLTLCFYANTFSCDCKEIDRDSAVVVGLRNSDLVFTGNLISSDFRNDTYSFEIFEIFKGDYDRDTIWGKGYYGCSFFPSEKGIWIVYANKKNDSTIDMDGCLYSMSLRKFKMVPPPPEMYKEGQDTLIEYFKYKIYELESNYEHIAMWFADYEKLKKYKSDYQKTKTTTAQTITNDENPNIYLFIAMFLLVTNMILLIVLIRKKK
jgi:hypothetical protein